MRFKQAGNKRDGVAVVIKNAESSASIPLGSPVHLVLNATDDGLAVVLPATAPTLAHGGAFGVALSAIGAGNFGEAQVFGYCSVMLQTGTRTASGETFSTASGAVGIMLVANTINNNFITSGGTLAQSAYLPYAILAESYTVAGSASATSDTRTAATALVKAFLRMM